MRPTFATTRRWLGAAALAAVCIVPAQAQRNVTLRLNTATLPDTTRIATAGIQVRGCLASATCVDNQSPLPGGQTIAWDARTTLRPTNVGGDYWNVSFQIPDNEQLNFKFFSQQSDSAPPAGSGIGGWEDGDNLTIPAGTGPVTLDLHYFNRTGTNQPYDWRPFGAAGDSVAVWFRVFMNTENAVNDGYTDPGDAALVVAARGNFGTLGAVGADGPIVDWGGTNARFRRESTNPSQPGYNIFSGAVRYPASAIGQRQNYKFYFNDSNTTGDGPYEDTANDRSFVVPAQDSTLYIKNYGDSRAVVGTVATANNTFRVDVRPLSDAGIFNVSDDSLQVRGGFNGWDCPQANQDDCLLSRIPGSFNYARTIPITAVAGSTAEFKYFIDFEPPLPNPDFGYEEPLDNGGSNRPFVFTGQTETRPTAFFNDIRAGNVIPAGVVVNVRFRVDMNPARSFPVTPFNPATDSVYVNFQDRIWMISQGYTAIDVLNSGYIPGFVLTDPDADGVYEGVLAVRGPSYNGIGYSHAYGGTQAGETRQVEGSGGFGPGRRRYRYVNPGGGTYPANFTFAYDVFRQFGTGGTPTPWEVNPTSTVAPGSLPNSIANGANDPLFGTATEPTSTDRPSALRVSPAAPNPVRNGGAIEYAIPQSGQVSLVVYDVTGREVITLVDEQQAAGSYRTTFDVSGLPAGVYVYQLRAASGVASGRMTVVR